MSRPYLPRLLCPAAAWCLLAVVLNLSVTAPAPADEPQPETATTTEADPPEPADTKPNGDKPEKPAEKPEKPKDLFAWRPLFDGKTLKGWKVPEFGGEGEVKVKKGVIVLGLGDPMTGITYEGELPKVNYEFRMEARRTMGIDFFATTTFPYGDSPCSFVVGGWAGTVVGLSCVDWYDASDNITTKFIAFKDKQWYRIRIRVSEQRIEAWIDDEKMVDLATKGHKFTIRDEVDLCQPFGICTYCTEGQIRKPEIRLLKPEEVAEIPVRDRWD